MSSPRKGQMATWVAGAPIRRLDTSNPSGTAYVYDIPVTTGNGAQSTVSVPESRIGDLAYVRSQLAAVANMIDPIATMTSEGG